MHTYVLERSARNLNIKNPKIFCHRSIKGLLELLNLYKPTKFLELFKFQQLSFIYLFIYLFYISIIVINIIIVIFKFSFYQNWLQIL